jgi:hypothetical protein
MICTIAISHALLIEFEKMVTFSATLSQGNVSIVMELAVRTTSPSMVESTTTLVVVPWIIESTGGIVTFMRFHHLAIDAKSEVVHAIGANHRCQGGSTSAAAIYFPHHHCGKKTIARH